MEKIKQCPICLTLLGDGTRTKIIQQLKRKANRVSDIGAYFSLTQPTISYHLSKLLELGAVLCKKRGREVFYFLNKKYPCKKCQVFKQLK